MDMPNTTYLTAAQLVARWNNAVTTGTLSNWRSKGEGPVFTKFGRTVRYSLADVLAYEALSKNDNQPNGQQVAA